MKINVIGAGRWGSFIAWYLNKIGHEVTLSGRRGSPSFEELRKSRSNGLLVFPESLNIEYLSGDALREADIVAVSVGAQDFRELMASFLPEVFAGKPLVLCMKGIEASTGKRLTEIAAEYSPRAHTAIWVGPGHVQEFAAGVPNCMVIDSDRRETAELLVNAFAGELIRFYYGDDLIGNEVGAASKNVVGIAAGMIDGLGQSALKGALMSRGAREISRLIAAMGGKEITAYGLSHLGDYEATVFSLHSHNRRFGEALVKGERFEVLAEGAATSKAMALLSQRYNVELPICDAVYRVIYGREDPPTVLKDLFMRSLKKEF